jgi:hypothetical protein
VINKNHPVKTMFMGAITKPTPERNFNGTISIKRLSRQHVIQRRTHRYHFSLDYDVNQQRKDGEWRQLHDDATCTMGELSRLIVEFFFISATMWEMFSASDIKMGNSNNILLC